MRRQWRNLVSTAVVLTAVLAAETAQAVPAKTIKDGDRGPSIRAAQARGLLDRVPRQIGKIIKTLSDELIGPRP